MMDKQISMILIIFFFSGTAVAKTDEVINIEERLYIEDKRYYYLLKTEIDNLVIKENDLQGIINILQDKTKLKINLEYYPHRDCYIKQSYEFKNIMLKDVLVKVLSDYKKYNAVIKSSGMINIFPTDAIHCGYDIARLNIEEFNLNVKYYKLYYEINKYFSKFIMDKSPEIIGKCNYFPLKIYNNSGIEKHWDFEIKVNLKNTNIIEILNYIASNYDVSYRLNFDISFIQIDEYDKIDKCH